MHHCYQTGCRDASVPQQGPKKPPWFQRYSSACTWSLRPAYSSKILRMPTHHRSYAQHCYAVASFNHIRGKKLVVYPGRSNLAFVGTIAHMVTTKQYTPFTYKLPHPQNSKLAGSITATSCNVYEAGSARPRQVQAAKTDCSPSNLPRTHPPTWMLPLMLCGITDLGRLLPAGVLLLPAAAAAEAVWTLL